MKREDTFKVKEQFIHRDQSTIVGTLLEGINYKILLDNGVTNVFIKYLGREQVKTYSFLFPSLTQSKIICLKSKLGTK